jgi:DDE superfamily endonuclease
LYSDYLISSCGQVTATGLSQITNISNDKVSRFLGGVKFDKTGDKFEKHEFTAKDLWLLVKSKVRDDEDQEAVITIDDSICEKEFTDENDIMCWHYDHSKSRSVKGINLVNYIYQGQTLSIPISFDLVTKTEIVQKKDKNGNMKDFRVSVKSKNQMVQDNIKLFIQNQIKFKYFFMDIWFGCSETLNLIHSYKKYYITPIKSNRKVALSKKDKSKKNWVKLENINFKDDQVQEVWIESMDHPVLLTKQVFTNKDSSAANQYLITNNLSLVTDSTSYPSGKDNKESVKNIITKLYHKRWKIEEYHKSMKSLLGLTKSPTKNQTTQSNHFFCTIYSYFKMEMITKFSQLKSTTSTATKTIKNHFQLKSQIYVKANQLAFEELQNLKSQIQEMKLLVPCER